MTFSTASATVGAPVRASGKVTNTPKGSLVKIQRRSPAHRWITVRALRTTDKTGDFTGRFRIKALQAGYVAYRAVAPARGQTFVRVGSASHVVRGYRTATAALTSTSQSLPPGVNTAVISGQVSPFTPGTRAVLQRLNGQVWTSVADTLVSATGTFSHDVTLTDGDSARYRFAVVQSKYIRRAETNTVLITQTGPATTPQTPAPVPVIIPVAITSPGSGGQFTKGDTPAVTGTGQPGASIAVSLDDTALTPVTVGADGTWSAQLPPLAAGTPSVVVTQDADNSTDGVVLVVNSPADANASAIAVSGPALTAATSSTPATLLAGKSATVTVTVKDASGSQLPTGQDQVVIASDDAALSVGDVSDNGDGTYSATITADATFADIDTAGLSFWVNDTASTGTVAVRLVGINLDFSSLELTSSDVAAFALPAGVLSLNLAGNQITDATALTLPASLQTLDLSDNPLGDRLPVMSSATALSSLNLSGVGLSTISAGQLPASLTNLDASANTLADATGAGLALPAGLTTVNLADDGLTGLPATGLTALSNLDLSGNQITDASALALPAALSTLNLADNQLAAIGAGVLPASLTSLDLSGNALDLSNDPDDPPTLGNLVLPAGITTLSLAYNGFTSLPDGLFAATGSLTSLDLTGNGLDATSLATLPHPGNLTITLDDGPHVQ